MSDENETPTTAPKYPSNWRIAADYDPNQHLMNLKGRDYLNVQNRLLWFIRDQRDFIVRGLATTSYVIRTELVEQDREAGFAHFKTYVRDVMGNEAVMYGSESAKDFADYAEKASTKSLGRALLALGYGTAFAPEMDEGDRIVDTPVERKPQPAQPPQRPFTANPPVIRPAVDEPAATSTATTKPARQFATPQQWTAIHNLCEKTKAIPPEPGSITTEQAGVLIAELSETYKHVVAQRQREGAAR